MLELKKPRRTREQTKALWHRKAKEREYDIICFRCHTITNRIHHHCLSHRYGKGYSLSVCTKCHGEINALVWNPEKHLIRGPYWGEQPDSLIIPQYLVKPNLFKLALPEAENSEVAKEIFVSEHHNDCSNDMVEIISVKHRESGKTYYLRGCSYSEICRITGFTRNMIIDSYVGTYPLIIIAGKEYAAGFGPLSEYWIRDRKDIAQEMGKLEDKPEFVFNRSDASDLEQS